MEEKRSCHSLHSVRSTRSFLSRPTSDISYLEDEEKGKMASKLVNNVAGSNGHYIRANNVQSPGNNQSHNNVKVQGVADTNYASNYLKVEGGAYRVTRSSSGGSTNNSAQSCQTVDTGHGRGRASIDVGTQSCASSCTQTDESCLAPLTTPLVLHPPAQPPVYLDQEMARSQSAMASPYTRATSPTPPYAYGTAVPPPTTCYHPPTANPAYDPNTAYYHTYLNPLVDAGTGLQYDIIVRRPSVGPVLDMGDPGMRRPSVGAPSPVVIPPHLIHHHLSHSSHQGSFDSSGLPPPGQPLSPRHLHSSSSNILSTSPIAPHHQADNLLSSSHDQLSSKPSPIPSVPPNTTTSDIPKLIHETSI